MGHTLFIAIFVVALWVSGSQAAAAQEQAARVEDSFGGKCSDCHEHLVDSYAKTGMARALEALRPGELAGLLGVEDKNGLRYHFEGARLVETRAAKAGAPPHRDSAPLVFAIGAGMLDRSYAARKNERLWFAPLEVVSETKGRARHAALSPPHTIHPDSRFTVPITPECLACHTDSPPPRDWPLNRAPAKELWQPTGISCAACHSHGEEHMQWRLQNLSGDTPETPDPVLNPGRLERTKNLSVCAACHLQGDARIELKPGRVGPPAPGGDLLEQREIFVAARPTNEIGFVSHVERLVLSRCYLGTGSGVDGLSCTSCHDPHRSLQDPVERTRVRAACSQCHDSAAPVHATCSMPLARRASRDCVDCHMRKTGVFDVEAVEIHDHWIRKDPGPKSRPGPLRFPESPTGDWKAFRWPDVPAPAHHGDPGLRLMALYHGSHFQQVGPLMNQRSLFAGKLAMYHHARAMLFELSGQFEEALAEYRIAIRIDPDLAESVSNLGLLHGRLGNTKTALRVLDTLIARHPLADGALRNRAVIKRASGDTQGFLADFEAAQKLLPRADLARILAEEWKKQGRSDKANYWQAEAERLAR